MRRLALALVAVLAAAPAYAEAPGGSYAYVASESDNVATAIDTAIAPMNMVFRTVARGRLAKVNQPYQHVKLTTGAKITIVTDGRAPISAANGATIKWTRPEDGEKLDVTLRQVGNRVEESFSSPDGKRVNVFEPSADGKKLLMTVTVTSPKLPKALKYRLGYRKDS